MITKIVLKHRLKYLYKKIEFGFSDYDCGHSLLIVMNLEYRDLCEKFNKTADKLSLIDDNCPKFRYKLEK